MTRDINIEAEQAVLGSVLADSEALAEIGDLFRPDLFGATEHAEIAREILALAAEKKPADAVLVIERLAARKAGVEPSLVLELSRAMGTTANVRHYAQALDSLWAKRAAKAIALEMVRSDLDVSGEEFVGRFAERLSAIETKRGRPARMLAEVMYERLERREAIQKNPELLLTWPTGFGQLDALIGGFRPGHLVTLAARPGVGKTSVLAGVMESLADRRIPVGVFMLEDYGDALADRAFMRGAQIPSTYMRDAVRWTPEQWRRAGVAVNERARWPIYVDDQHGRTIHDVVGAMRRMVREHGVKVFFLDNLSEIVLDRQDRGEERLDRALGRIAKTYRDAAHALGAAPVLVVHLNRDVEKRGADARARLSDLKNSGEIEDASHVVAMLSRRDGSDELVVDVAKNRNGPRGEVTLHWDGATMTVSERRAA